MAARAAAAWVQVRLTVAIEDPRARERRLMGMEVRRPARDADCVGASAAGCALQGG